MKYLGHFSWPLAARYNSDSKQARACVCPSVVPRVISSPSSRPDTCSHCSNYRFHSRSSLRSVWPADIEGKRRCWLSSAPLAGWRSSCGECSCTAWRHRRVGPGRLPERKRNGGMILLKSTNTYQLLTLLSNSIFYQNDWLVLYLRLGTNRDVNQDRT